MEVELLVLATGLVPNDRNDKLAIAETADPPNTLHPDRPWYTTDVFADWALKFLDEAESDERPFFLYVAFNSPHWPLEAPEAKATAAVPA